MNNKIPSILFGFASSLLVSTLGHASNLGQFDVRSMAMGGTGVGGTYTANASAFNPALMATEANRRSFSFIPLGIRLEAFDENSFADTIDDAEVAINEDGTGLNDLLQGMEGIGEETCGGDPCYKHANMEPASIKANEVFGHIENLNKSNGLISSNVGAAIQFGQRIPMALVVDGGLYTRVGLKFSERDTNELNAYFQAMDGGEITQTELGELLDQGLVSVDGGGNLNFETNGEDKELRSLIEVLGAAYTEVGLSLADSFQYNGKELSLGITPKIVKVRTIKFHAGVESEDIETDDITDDENIEEKTDFNADVGLAIKPFDTQPLQVGVTIKNLFTRSYELKKTATELALEDEARGTGDEAILAASELDTFAFRQTLEIEPQVTVGLAYDLKLLRLQTDVDLNAAEVLGKTTQHLGFGAEFDLRILKLQAGYRTSIGGDDEDDALSAGVALGFLGLGAIKSGDQIGAALQLGFSF